MLNRLTFTALIMVIIGCDQNHELPPDLVAQVNDAYLIKENLNYRVSADLPAETQLSMKKMLIKQWVEDEIVYQSALNEGVQWEENDLFQIENYKKSLLIQKYLDNKLNKNFRISEKEIEDFYNDNKKEFIRKKDEAHIIHLFIEKKDNAIFSEINESKNLQEIIDKYYFNTRSTYERPNGDLGYISIEALPDIIQKTIARQKTGTISDPLKSDDGYHFIQLMDKQNAGTQIDLELVKDQIVLRLKWQKREQERERLMDTLREKFQVQTYLSKVQ
jgi:parvulin-like peptidyl-prolyl isomerase